MSNFKIAVTTIFIICFIVGIALFASSKGSSSQQAAHLLVWGPLTPDQFDQAYKASSLAADKLTTITYVKKNPSAFEKDFIEALADGSGPDGCRRRRVEGDDSRAQFQR